MLYLVYKLIDIRYVLLLLIECKIENKVDIIHEELHETIKYHDDIFAVQATAESGCQLYAFVWHEIQEQGKR